MHSAITFPLESKLKTKEFRMASFARFNSSSVGGSFGRLVRNLSICWIASTVLGLFVKTTRLKMPGWSYDELIAPPASYARPSLVRIRFIRRDEKPPPQ